MANFSETSSSINFLVDQKSKMNLLILVIFTQSFVSARFNRRAALLKYHHDSKDATTSAPDAEQPASESAEEQPNTSDNQSDLRWKRIRAAAIKRRQQTSDKRRQHMLNLISQSHVDNSKYQALLQTLLKEENKRRQIKKNLHYALYSMNLI